MLHAPNQFRVRKGERATDDSYGTCGMFYIPASLRRAYALIVICSDGEGWEENGYPPPAWEHVSVSTAVRCPTWEEMCFIKSLFWDPEDVVIQFHPRASEYVNNHPHCLHLWRPIGVAIPTPPLETVGVTA